MSRVGDNDQHKNGMRPCVGFLTTMKLFLSALLIMFGSYAGLFAETFPIVEKFVVPVYPPAAVAVTAGGEVQIGATVDATGNVLSAKAISGHPLLQQAAENATRSWRFSPTPGNHFIVLRFVFRLSDRSEKEEAELVGSYQLRFVRIRPQIIQTVSHG